MELNEIMDGIAAAGNDDMWFGFNLAVWTWNKRKVEGLKAVEVEALIKADAPRYGSRASAASQSKMLKVVGKYNYDQLVKALDAKRLGHDWTSAVKLSYGDFDVKPVVAKVVKVPAKVQKAVAAGIITQAQADAIAAL